LLELSLEFLNDVSNVNQDRNMHRNKPKFASLLRSAAEVVAGQTQHPGQVLPGVWGIDPVFPYDVMIGLITAQALAVVCRDQDMNLDAVLISYLEVSRMIRLRPVGAPDKMAIAHLREAADALEADTTAKAAACKVAVLEPCV
jgi:hypothetical protein